MRDIFQDPYRDVSRWDMISRFPSIGTSNSIPKYKSIKLRMHEVTPKQYRDRHVQSFVLELISGQRVSPALVSKGAYKKKLVVKKATKSSQIQVALRNSRLVKFLIRWGSLAMPSAQYFRGLGLDISVDRNSNLSFYYPDTLSFMELFQFNIFIYSCNAIQFHISHSPKITDVQAKYLLSTFHVPFSKETYVDPHLEFPSLAFFKK